MNTKNTKAKHRFNVIDVLIIIGIIAAVIFCIGVLSGRFAESKIATVHYCVKLEGVDENASSALTKGMRIYSTDMNIPVGVVRSSESKLMTITSYDHSQNRFVTEEQEGLYTMYLYMSAGCVYEDGCYKTENIRISENTSLDINLPFLYDSAEIVSVTPVVTTEEK